MHSELLNIWSSEFWIRGAVIIIPVFHKIVIPLLACISPLVSEDCEGLTGPLIPPFLNYRNH